MATTMQFGEENLKSTKSIIYWIEKAFLME